MKLLDQRKAVGQAIWLWLLYQNNAKYSGDRNWAPVLDAHTVRDSDAAEALKVPVHTVTRWRYRLERVGIVRTMPCRGGGFKVWLRHSDLPCDESLRQPQQQGNWPAMQTEVVQ
jgi:hypothetical protein